MASNENDGTPSNTGKGGKKGNRSAAAAEDDDTAAAEHEPPPPPYDPRQLAGVDLDVNVASQQKRRCRAAGS